MLDVNPKDPWQNTNTINQQYHKLLEINSHPKISNKIKIPQTEIGVPLWINTHLWTSSYFSPSIHSTLSKEEQPSFQTLHQKVLELYH